VRKEVKAMFIKKSNKSKKYYRLFLNIKNIRIAGNLSILYIENCKRSTN
jgi:hypothetical protein